MAEDVQWADWAPNGEDLAILRRMPTGGRRLEYPIGRVLHEGPGVSPPRISPDGARVAFLEIDRTHFTLAVAERTGTRRRLSSGWEAGAIPPLMWTASGREILFFGGRDTDEAGIRAVDLDGRERTLYPADLNASLHDVAPDGRLLFERYVGRVQVFVRPADAARETECTFWAYSNLADVSPDGRTVLFWNGEDRVPEASTRTADGAPR